MIIIYLIIVLAIGLGYFMLLSKYGKLWEEIPRNEETSVDKIYSISVLIPFRNEEKNLPALTLSFSRLNKGKHTVEFVFINDHSDDNSVSAIKDNLSTARILELEDGSGKKLAITKGIANANGDIILQTDADCVVHSEWISEMVEPFNSLDVNLVSGPVKFFSSNKFWSKLVNLDFAALIAIGAAHIKWGKPMLCNGANMAYRKSLVEGLEYNTEKASGDDVFLLQHAASVSIEGVVFKKSEKAIVETNGPNSFLEFWNQRLRWSSKNSDYSDKLNVWILGGIWFYNALILISLLTFSPVFLLGAVFLIIVKVISEDSFYGKFSEFFGFNLWFTNIFVGQPFHILYMAILPPLSQILKYKWKERKVK
jgi:cellulose synthase/poly-beta-1,6-N-acetylglucosamine synthase-like glycosyltransferase